MELSTGTAGFSRLSDNIDKAISLGVPAEQLGAILMAEAGLTAVPGIEIEQKNIDTFLGLFRN